jgi:heme/copper-type cytochrome/quinol oxidase subunit 2
MWKGMAKWKYSGTLASAWTSFCLCIIIFILTYLFESGKRFMDFTSVKGN